MRHAELTEDLQERASLYAAGALPESERAEYARHIEEDECAVCRAEVTALQTVMALVGSGVAAASPSPAVKARLMEQARNAPGPRKDQGSFFRRHWLELIAGTAAISAVVVMLSAVYANRELQRLTQMLVSRISQLEIQMSEQRTYIAALTSPDARIVDLAGQGPNTGAGGRIFWDRSTRRWRVFVHDLPRAAENRDYQLWFVPTTGNPVSAAVFNTQPDGSAELDLELPENLPGLKAAAVTTEPAGGLPQPTGSFVLLGAGD